MHDELVGPENSVYIQQSNTERNIHVRRLNISAVPADRNGRDGYFRSTNNRRMLLCQ
jgi:hypothetical protein